MRSRFLLCTALCVCLLLALPGSPKRVVRAESTSDGSEGPPTIELEQKVVPGGLQTDHETAAREGLHRGKEGEKFQFQAEVSRLMDIIIHSLYSNKDIFLRELISNASDALDKIRFLSLTDQSVLGEGEDAKLEIKIKLDKDKRILSIRDRGIGMTKDDLIKNLGTIAKSGTSAFLEQMQQGGDLNLIGQFGVGFYSVYLVADFVEVISKHNDDKQWVWESRADGAFTVLEDTEGESLGRGTQINIHLKDETAEYLEEDKLKTLVKKFSEFINFPIYLWSSKTVDKEVPAEDDEGEDEDKEEAAKEEEDEEKEEEEEVEEEKKPKTVKETVWDWELLNDVKALWLRSSKDVTDEEYVSFYKTLTKDWDKPLSWTHFNAEGDVEFRAILFVPSHAPHDFYDNFYTSKPGLKLYVRRVFISDEFEDLLPKYLSFLKGLVDSDTLPLNVSREMLQQHGSLRTIKKKLVRKALDMIRKIAEDDEEDTKKDKDEEENEGEEPKKESSPESKGQYAKFWKEYGKAIKLGVIEDSGNRVRLAKLLRFHSSKSSDKLTSLEEYISRMKDGQKHIYYLTGDNQEKLARSPFVEKLLNKGYEVIYFTDALDEYVMQNLTEFDDKKFQNASKEDLKMADRDEKEKKRFKEVKESFKDLTKWWKDLLSEEVQEVKVSNRLHKTPCVVVTSKYGWSANMERIMKAQALTDSEKQTYMKGKKLLEINPHHPIVKELRERQAADSEDESLKGLAQVMYDTALIDSGFVMDDTKGFAARLHSLVRRELKVEGDFEEEVEEEEEPEVVEEGGEEAVKGEGAGTRETADENKKTAEESTKTAEESKETSEAGFVEGEEVKLETIVDHTEL